jgi:hypothetical protein
MSECGCIKCCDARMKADPSVWPGPGMPGWRYACNLCGNKRCPHHSDHELDCTGSNEPGQPGSVFK